MKSQMTQWRYTDTRILGQNTKYQTDCITYTSLKLYISQHVIIVGLSKERQKRRVMKSEKLMDTLQIKHATHNSTPFYLFLSPDYVIIKTLPKRLQISALGVLTSRTYLTLWWALQLHTDINSPSNTDLCLQCYLRTLHNWFLSLTRVYLQPYLNLCVHYYYSNIMQLITILSSIVIIYYIFYYLLSSIHLPHCFQRLKKTLENAFNLRYRQVFSSLHLFACQWRLTIMCQFMSSKPCL